MDLAVRIEGVRMRFRSYVILVYLKHEARSCCTVKIASLTTCSKAIDCVDYQQ